ncbi:TBC domain containing protein [Histomonas meleagridis]|uniref:TBC domain containing protein n=1 Tax=Histomonas meleagridis TaxID=135588 RepID=UPI0035594604|nr:TBC domain containing protein [Histomonas meleagridis]KAH0803370.1 TBC domain containing protein [Histomonas meleagridis]
MRKKVNFGTSKGPKIKRSSTPDAFNSNKSRGSHQSSSNNEFAKISQEKEIEELLSAKIIDVERIRADSWAGIPDKFRAQVWRLFLDYEPVNSVLKETTLAHKRSDYFDCVGRVFTKDIWTNSQKQTESQILRDLPRTSITILRNERIQSLLNRVLFVWSIRHPASDYVQGMNDLLQVFFFTFLLPKCPGKDISEIFSMKNLDFLSEDIINEIEADCFWCFSKLLDGLQDLYTKDQPGIYRMLESLSTVIDRVDPALSRHIRDEGIQYQEFAFRWMNCFLVREFPMELIFRLWDFYLSNHTKISTTHVYICAALMTTLSPKLCGLSHSEFIVQIQSLHKNKWTIQDLDVIIAQAYVYEKMFSRSPSHLRSSSLPNFDKI